MPSFFRIKRISTPAGLFEGRIYPFLRLDIIYLRSIISLSQLRLYNLKCSNSALSLRLITYSAFRYAGSIFTFFSEKISVYSARYSGNISPYIILLRRIRSKSNAYKYIIYTRALYRTFCVNSLIFINSIFSSNFIEG